MSPLTAEEAGQKALDATNAFVSVTTSLATGALVFSIGFLATSSSLSDFGRHTLLASWICFGLSIFAAVFFAQASIPVKMHDQNYDLEDPYFTWPTRVHQVLFFFGIVALGLTLLDAFSVAAPYTSLKTVSATGALMEAKSKIPRGRHLTKVNALELLKGVDANDARTAVWHVQMDLAPNRAARAPASVLDVYVSTDGRATTVAQSSL